MEIRAPRASKIVLDIALALVLLLVMTTALVQEAPHEYLGIALFVLVVIHAIQNRKMLPALLKVGPAPIRVVQALTLLGLAVCFTGQLISALILSQHALAFLPAMEGAAWARQVHLLCSYWFLLFASAHAGLKVRRVVTTSSFLKNASGTLMWALRLAWLIAALYGVVAFAQLGLADYLFAQAAFAFVDFETPLVLTFVRYACIAALVAGIAHYLETGLHSFSKKH